MAKTYDHRITFPKELYEYIKVRTKQIGMNVPEYVRHLILNDVSGLVEADIFVDEETEKAIGRGLEAYKNGRTIGVHTEKELDDFFKNL